MTTTSPMHEYMTGFAAWENPWPFEDSVATTTRTRREAPPEEMIMLEATENAAATWRKVCAFDDLDIGAGTCVLAGGQQVAIFRIAGDVVRAVQNQCPHRGAAAMHQGLVGERGGQAAVFCPLHKRAYSLDDGTCLDEEGARLRPYQVRVVSGMVEVLA